MGKLLKKMNVAPDIIISSPAIRALSTAQALAHELDYPLDNILAEKTLYEAGEKELFSVIGSINSNYDTAMIVGHNPTLTYFVETLTGESLGNIPTCGIVYINLFVDNWDETAKGIGKIKFFEFPKKYF
jgi:phosphohistidine phosphatase